MAKKKLKDTMIGLRVTAELAREIEAQAEKEFLPTAAWLRRAIQQALQAAKANTK